MPSEDMMGSSYGDGASQEYAAGSMYHLWIINGNDHQLSADERFKEDSRDVDFIAAGHEDESIEETGFLEVRSLLCSVLMRFLEECRRWKIQDRSLYRMYRMS